LSVQLNLPAFERRVRRITGAVLADIQRCTLLCVPGVDRIAVVVEKQIVGLDRQSLFEQAWFDVGCR
jgi:hypothetical protein